MSCNPCCCLKLKDAAITIGIWSTIYALVQIGIFGWQFSVLAQCQHVTMAQANLQCEYYCPCVGASTARTSAIIEGLFVIQILCLIVAFFLLFASIMMIYGVHTWSRYLLVPWMVTMCASILTTLAYCIMWWAGDVRDYWLMLTIVEMFGVFLNTYCFVVICVFHRRMLAELEYYARRRKYDRFSQQQPQQHSAITTPHTIEQDSDDLGDEFGQQQQKRIPPVQGGSFRRPPAGQFPYRPSPQPIRPLPVTHQPASRYYPNGYRKDTGQMPTYPERVEMPKREFYAEQKTPMERFQQEVAIVPAPPPPPPQSSFFNRNFVSDQRPRSSMEQRTYPSQYDEFGQRRTKCRQCGRAHGPNADGTIAGSGRRHHPPPRWCHHCLDHCHCHAHTGRRHRKYSCSSITSITNGLDWSDEERHKRKAKRKRRSRRRKSGGGPGHWSEQETVAGQEEESELNAEIQSEHNYGNISMLGHHQRERESRQQRQTSLEKRRKQPPPPLGRGDTLQKSTGKHELALTGGGTLPRPSSQQFFPPQGISIPQHIIIPPVSRADDGVDSQAERQYRINSEITISYDQQQQPQSRQSPIILHPQQPKGMPPAIPPRRAIIDHQQQQQHSAVTSSPFGSIRERPQQAMSITSNV